MKKTSIFIGWNCDECGTLNTIHDISCKKCYDLGSDALHVFKKTDSDTEGTCIEELGYNGFWLCKECGESNPLHRKYHDNICLSCSAVLPRTQFKILRKNIKYYIRAIKHPRWKIVIYNPWKDFSLKKTAARCLKLSTTAVSLFLAIYLLYLLLISLSIIIPDIMGITSTGLETSATALDTIVAHGLDSRLATISTKANWLSAFFDELSSMIASLRAGVLNSIHTELSALGRLTP